MMQFYFADMLLVGITKSNQTSWSKSECPSTSMCNSSIQ